jgi:sucrose phosphorylase
MSFQNKVILITYGDSLGGNLGRLADLLDGELAGAFGAVHVLPPFPSSADRGFAPTTYERIEPALGDWPDMERIGRGRGLVVDMMVNHISRQSAYFKDFIAHGRSSRYADYFITLDKVWPDGVPKQADVAKIHLRKPGGPFSDIEIASGGVERVWTSFGGRDWSEQIDLDVGSSATRGLFESTLRDLKSHSVSTVRLDAVGYVIKKPGTNCFFVEPEIWDFLDWIKAAADRIGIELLPEVHAELSYNVKLAERGYWVYDFGLPALVLHSFFSGSAAELRSYLGRCPRHQCTTLDCHDGIPILPDLTGILDVANMRRIVDRCVERGANVSRILSDDGKVEGFDAHQINISYYSAMGEDDEAYLAARAIQLFAPGIPQIYYVGLLAGRNDPATVVTTGDGRYINRHDYSAAEVRAELDRPVVRRLLELIELRNSQPAFSGDLSIGGSGPSRLELAWSSGSNRCSLSVDFAAKRASITDAREGADSRTIRLWGKD